MVQTVRRNPLGRSSRYFPSIRTILLVRFDPVVRDRYDPGQVRVETSPDPAYLERLKKERFDKLLGRQLETGPKVLGDRAREAITAANVNLADSVARMPVDGLSRFIDLQPIASSRRGNSYRLPDELELTISWKSIPFDSRLIRAMLVFHYEGTVSADAFSVGVPEQVTDVPNATGYLIPATGANLKFVGQVDEISDTHGEDGDVVTLKARDLTSLLIDAKLPVGFEKKIRPSTTILEVVSDLLKTNPEFEILRGPYARVSGELPKLSPEHYSRLAVAPKERHRASAVEKAYDSKIAEAERLLDSAVAAGELPSRITSLSATVDSLKRGRPVSSEYVIRRPSKGGGEDTYWDAITDLAVSHGLVPTIELDSLVLLEPRTLYKDTPTLLSQPGVSRFPRPGGARIAAGDVSTVRRMVFGLNMKELRFFRKLGRIKAPAVRVTSFNPDAKEAKRRLLSVTHPPNVIAAARAGKIAGSRSAVESPVDRDRLLREQKLAREKGLPPPQATKVSATGQNATIEVHNVILEGIIDEDQLRRIAEQVYEAMGRQELGVTFSTDDLASWSSSDDFDPNEEPDLLDLRAGDPIQISVASSPERGSDLFSIAEFGKMVQRIRVVAEAGGRDGKGDAIRYLEERGFSTDAAKQFVEVLSTANLPMEFRVNTFQVDFGEDGFSIQIDARDYIRVRADPEDVSQTRSLDAAVAGGVVA